MAKIDRFSFGSIIVDGRKYRRDVLIFVDGTVKKRKGGFLMFGSHKIKKEEIEKLTKGQPEAIVIGMGTNGAARLAPEVEGWAKENKLNLLLQPSYDAVTKINEFSEKGKKVAALIHITC